MIPRELLKGAQNCVVGCGQIHEGQQVLIVNGPDADPRAVEAVQAVAEMQGADVAVLWLQRLAGGWFEHAPRIGIAAFEAADIVINNSSPLTRGHKPIHRAMFEKGVVMIRSYGGDEKILGSQWAQFPFEVYNDMELRLMKFLKEGKQYRVTDRFGTDMVGELDGPAEHRKDTVLVSRSPYRHFPPGVHPPIRSMKSNGVIYMRNTYGDAARLFGMPETVFPTPVKLTVEDNMVTRIEGGPEADGMKRYFDFLAHSGTVGQDAYRVTSWHTGMHHMAFSPYPRQLDPNHWNGYSHHHSGYFHFHIGLDPSEDTGVEYMTHAQATVFNPTIWIDGEKVWEDGDPEFIALTRQYGDPNRLLRYQPLAVD
jgi:hypothetical protein